MPTRGDGQVDLSFRQRMKEFNWTLGFLMFYMASCAFNFGYDVGMFNHEGTKETVTESDLMHEISRQLRRRPRHAE
jgi:hypothetical protein